MGRIQSNVGLITGIPITDTINQLLGVASRPRDLLTSRNRGLQQEQVAINTLSSRVLSLKFDLDRLKVSDPFQSRAVTSSKPDLLTAVLNGDTKPSLGSFSLRPAQAASSQQLISQRFESVDDIKDAGIFSFGLGGFVDKGISLDDLNNGLGVSRGEIKITDLAGNSSVIDVSLARTVDEVIAAINNDSTLNVTASTDGDSFTLVDHVGGSGTISVQEVNGGSTATDLGLTSITSTTQSEVVAGTDVYGLHADTKLAKLNDGNGVRYTNDTELVDGEKFELDDLVFTFQDGSLDADDEKFGVDLTGATTLGDVVDAINNDTDLSTRVTAAISSDGNRLELTDLTTGGGTFTVDNGSTGTAADDLGLTTTAAAGVISGSRLVSGLRDTLSSSLNGGLGFDPGSIVIFDRDGEDDTIDLSGAETLSDVVQAINNSSVNVTASINEARNGIVITDNTGGDEDFIIASVGDSTAAEDLGIAINAAQASVDSGTLNRQTISEATLLSSLNGGEGIKANDIRIFDSTGTKGEKGVPIDLNTSGSEAKTIGDVIDAINASTANVEARINDTGDGILITDTGTGEETLRIEDVNGSLAKVLNLTKTSETIEIEGTDTQVINGTGRYSVDLSTVETTDSSIAFESLNDGEGINRGDIRITDSAGRITSIDLNGADAGITTVEQLIEAINERSLRGKAQVTASINNSGTGILLTDTNNGSGNLKVEDINGTAAADLKILSTDTTTSSINGSGLFTAQREGEGALNNVATAINKLGAGVTASVLNDGQGFRLQLVVEKTGAANEILVSAGDSGFKFQETSQAKDALLVVGAGSSPGSGVLVSSSTNEFNDVIDGVDLTALSTSDTPIDVSVVESDKEILDLVKSFVDSYNSLRDDLGELTAFDSESLSTGLLFGTTEALRVDADLSRLLTNRYSGVGQFQSLQQIGISVNDSGKLNLDQAKLKAAFEEDPQSLQNLFTSKEHGVAAKFNVAIERLTNSETGLLTNRDNSLTSTIETNQARIERFNESLERQRERLELEFYNLELLISNMQTSQQAVNSIQAIPALTSSSS